MRWLVSHRCQRQRWRKQRRADRRRGRPGELEFRQRRRRRRRGAVIMCRWGPLGWRRLSLPAPPPPPALQVAASSSWRPSRACRLRRLLQRRLCDGSAARQEHQPAARQEHQPGELRLPRESGALDVLANVVGVLGNTGYRFGWHNATGKESPCAVIRELFQASLPRAGRTAKGPPARTAS